jgi:hypothetical protein
MIEEGTGIEILAPPTPEFWGQGSRVTSSGGHRLAVSDRPSLGSSIVTMMPSGTGSCAGVGRLAAGAAVLIGAAVGWSEWSSLPWEFVCRASGTPCCSRTRYHPLRVSVVPNCSTRPEGGGK